MNIQAPQDDSEKSRTILDLLEAIDRQDAQSQRALANKFGVALGLVNAYLKICIKKGYVKVRRLPARRYAYLLTPEGMAEKLRLTLLLLSRELASFRRARMDYRQACLDAHARGWRRIVLIGASELAEISAICALESDMEIVAVVDADLTGERFLGAPLVARLSDVTAPFDGAFITGVRDFQAAQKLAAATLGAERVLVPAFFGLEQEHAA